MDTDLDQMGFCVQILLVGGLKFAISSRQKYKNFVNIMIFGENCKISIFISLLFSIFLSSCANVYVNHLALPENLVDEAKVVNFESARSWADALSAEYLKSIELAQKQIKKSGIANADSSVLVLSGGGQDGAFGAGYLNGWTARGNRPEFEVITGVSAGALIAPFAFLGPDYDDELRRFYTTYSTKDILTPNLIGGLIGGGAAVSSSQPLANLIAEAVTSEFVAKIAREHRRGRRLALITTNLEAQRPVIWDMGQIASAGTPDAVNLFRSIVLASASIPAIFPPVAVQVMADGRRYTELHVDGATTTNLYLAPIDLQNPSRYKNRRGRIYILRNGKLFPDYQPMEARTISVASRALGTMSKYITKADVRRVKLFAQRLGAELSFISVPAEFDAPSDEPFDPTYMKALFDVGFSAGLNGKLMTAKPKVF